MPAKIVTELDDFLNQCRDGGIPCAFYSLPGSSDIKVMAQTGQKAHQKAKSNETGFVFAPFVENRKFRNIFIRADIYAPAKSIGSIKLPVPLKPVKRLPASVKLQAVSKAGYQEYVKKIRNAIRAGKLSKVVAARTDLKVKPRNFTPAKFFEKLSRKYPSAFVSLVYTPAYGLWIGATPEVLIEADEGQFKTWSLAGTKANTPANAKTPWGEKEKEEQKLVSDFIAKCFRKAGGKKPVIEGPVTVTAGNLLHLRTTFTYTGIPLSHWQKVAAKLHPTPAVAGLPRKKALSFVEKHELSLRAFYSGYLGPVNVEKSIRLFVNLRCAQVLDDKLALFVGCGITRDSDPEKEWMESKLKTETLLNAL